MAHRLGDRTRYGIIIGWSLWSCRCFAKEKQAVGVPMRAPPVQNADEGHGHVTEFAIVACLDMSDIARQREREREQG